jgi:hypothetical protein
VGGVATSGPWAPLRFGGPVLAHLWVKPDAFGQQGFLGEVDAGARREPPGPIAEPLPPADLPSVAFSLRDCRPALFLEWEVEFGRVALGAFLLRLRLVVDGLDFIVKGD